MSSNVKSYHRRSWRKQLAAAITAGSLAGAYASCALAAEYTQGLTGTVADNAWLGENVVEEIYGSTSYNLFDNYSFNVNGSSASGASFGKIPIYPFSLLVQRLPSTLLLMAAVIPALLVYLYLRVLMLLFMAI